MLIRPDIFLDKVTGARAKERHHGWEGPLQSAWPGGQGFPLCSIDDRALVGWAGCAGLPVGGHQGLLLLFN